MDSALSDLGFRVHHRGGAAYLIRLLSNDPCVRKRCAKISHCLARFLVSSVVFFFLSFSWLILTCDIDCDIQSGKCIVFLCENPGGHTVPKPFFNFHEIAVGRPLPGCFAAKPRDTNLDEAIDFPRFLRKPAGQAGRSVHGRVRGRSPFPERSRKVSRAARAARHSSQQSVPAAGAGAGQRPLPFCFLARCKESKSPPSLVHHESFPRSKHTHSGCE